MRCLTLDNQSEYFVKTVGLAEAGFAEIMREMHYKMDGKLPSHHRDSPTHVSLISHDPLHKINKEISHDWEDLQDRDDGPAVVYPDGKEYWYINGQQIKPIPNIIGYLRKKLKQWRIQQLMIGEPNSGKMKRINYIGLTALLLLVKMAIKLGTKTIDFIELMAPLKHGPMDWKFGTSMENQLNPSLI